MKNRAVGENMDLDAVLREAEKAVSQVKDERLREIAFGKILERFLSEGIATHKTSKKRRISPRKKKARRMPRQKGQSLWLEELIGAGFFKSPKPTRDIVGELSKRGHVLKTSDLTTPLQRLCQAKKLRRNKQIVKGGKKTVWHYSNW